MPYLTIENFKFGLDTRRGELTSQAGVLAVCENGHVNQGGEIDKRKAFVPLTAVGSYVILDTNGDQGLWGLEVTSIGPVIFGSALPFGSARTASTQGPKLASAVAAGVTYIQVQHPALWQGHGVTYDRTKHRVTKVVFTQSPSGLPFACVKYADGAYVLYYDWTIKSGDGTATTYYLASLIAESQNGVVFTPLVDDNNLAQELSRQINALDGWRGVFNTGINGRGNIYSPTGLSFAPVVSYTTASGNRIGVVAKDTNTDSITNVASRAPFEFVTLNSGGSSLITITAFSDAAGTVPITLMSNYGLGGLSIPNAVIAIADMINAFTSATGYSAATDGISKIAIYAPASFGAVTFNLTVTLTNGTMTPFATYGGPLSANLSTLSISATIDNKQATIYSPVVLAQPQGGTSASYAFAWQAVDNPQGIEIVKSTASGTTFKASLSKNTRIVGTFRCSVMNGTEQVSTPTVTVELTRGKVTLT